MNLKRPGARRKKPIVGAIKANLPLAHRVKQLRQYGLDNSISIIKEADMSKQKLSSRRGWTVVLAGTGINLALGILYTWSIFKGAIADSIAAGGTGSYDCNSSATEIQAGSYALMDGAYDRLDLPFEPAPPLVATVISVSPA